MGEALPTQAGLRRFSSHPRASATTAEARVQVAFRRQNGAHGTAPPFAGGPMSRRTAENQSFLQSVSLMSGNLNGCCLDLVELTQLQYDVTTVKFKIRDNIRRTDCLLIEADIFTCCKQLKIRDLRIVGDKRTPQRPASRVTVEQQEPGSRLRFAALSATGSPFIDNALARC
jgi:hypothetical protein